MQRRREALVEARRWREEVVGPRCLLGVVGGGVSTNHVGCGVTEEVLDIKLSCVLLDGPGGEGVAEPVGMDLRDARLPAQPAEHLFDRVGLK